MKNSCGFIRNLLGEVWGEFLRKAIRLTPGDMPGQTLPRTAQGEGGSGVGVRTDVEEEEEEELHHLLCFLHQAGPSSCPTAPSCGETKTLTLKTIIQFS